LLAEPFAGEAAQMGTVADDLVKALLDGQTIADAKGSLGGAKWGFNLTTQNVKADVALPPPGFQAASLRTPVVGGSPGFVFAAPLSGKFSFGISGEVAGNPYVKVAGQKICCHGFTLPFHLNLASLRVTASAQMDSAQPDRPRLVHAQIDPKIRLGGGGIFPQLNISPNLVVQNGQVSLVTGLTDIGFNLDGLSARFNGDLVITLLPSDATITGGENLDAVQAAIGVPAAKRVQINLPAMGVRVSLQGSLSIKLKRVGKVSTPWKMTYGTLLPTTPEINRALHALVPPLPRDVADGPPPDSLKTNASPPVDPSAALTMEQQIVAHLAEGTVLTIDAPGPTMARPGGTTVSHYGRESDSAIWTGHYLAAESFRYARTHDPAALERLRTVLGGVKQLFDVTQDAVVIPGSGEKPQILPVLNGPGLLSRALHVSTDPIDFKKPLNTHKCYYERPEGGWSLKMGRAAAQKFGSYRELYTALRGSPIRLRAGAQITPLGTVRYGWGCGDDEPVSRDQYIGVFMGLAFANQLVDDPGVRATSQQLVHDALGYITKNHWNLVLPPDNKIKTTFLGDIDLQLALLRVGATVDPNGTSGGSSETFLQKYQKVAPASELTWIPAWFTTLEPVSGYYKFNLAHATLAPLLFLEHDPTLRANYLDAYNLLWRTVRTHKNAWFDLLHVLVQTPSQWAATANAPSAVNPGITLSAEANTVLAEWLKRRDMVAGPNGLPLNRLADPATQANLWPNDITTYSPIGGSLSCIARAALPVYARIGNGADFMWQQNPFSLAIPQSKCTPQSAPPSASEVASLPGASDPHRESPGVDYLVAYWLASYLQLTP
jgi:hypothetical protein